MKRRTLPLIALSSSFALILTAHSAMASTNPATASKAIYLNGKLVSKPSGFVKNKTTYIPIWYVGHALSQAGISNTWKNSVMNFTVPASMAAKITSHDSKSGNVKISVNGKIVESCDGVVAIDPSSHKPTEYLPIWYVMQALKQMNITSQWDGTNWHLAMPSVASNGSSTGSSSSKSSGGSASGSTKSGASGSSSSSSSGSSTGGSGSSGSGSSTASGGSSSGSSGTSSTGASGSTASAPVNVADLTAAILGTTDYKALPTLFIGDMSPYVSALQSMLSQLGYDVKQTGNFDGATAQAVEDFQAAQKITQDGVVTPDVWQELQQFVMAIPAAPPQRIGSTTSSPTPATGTGFTNVDLRFPAPADINANSIDAYLQSHNAPMTGLGQTFMEAQQTYGVDANYLVSHAILESYWGKSRIAQAKNNLFGYGAYDSSPGQDAGLFPSEKYAILFQGWEVRNNYLNPGSALFVSPTLVGMNVHYATDAQWANSIGLLMGQLAKTVNDTVNSYPQYTPGSSAPAPESTEEPIFYIHASATVKPVANYPGLPYYSTPGEGAGQMFFGVLQQGSLGASVAAIQTYMNQTMNAGLTVDGQFGPVTKQAVMRFQAAHGMQQTGTWNYSMWQLFNPTPQKILPAGATVNISKIEMGMANGLVVEWDYVDGYGWVDANYLLLHNVYRAMALNPQSTNTTIHVYGPNKQTILDTLHCGAFVVANASTPQGGFYPVEISNQQTGQVMSGYISASEATLTQLQ